MPMPKGRSIFMKNDGLSLFCIMIIMIIIMIIKITIIIIRIRIRIIIFYCGPQSKARQSRREKREEGLVGNWLGQEIKKVGPK